jgi:hypothetical protein
MVALTSMAYNSVSTIGQNITRALHNRDRAEAWYEIQYNTNGGASASQGVANRRYREAALFGLYNEGPLNEEDAKAAYRMFTRHRTQILGADGALGGVDGYEDRYPPPEAGMSIFWQLKAARDYLLPLYDQGVPIAWSHVYVGENNGENGTQDTRYYRNTDADTLVGSAQNDLMFGESGDDILDAGAGTDILYGGTGNDTLKGGADLDYYMYSTGDGRDTLHDSDGQGQIRWNDTVLNGGQKLAGIDGDPNGVYRSADGLTHYVRYDDFLFITRSPNEDPRNGGGIVVENYTAGALDLNFDPNRPTPEIVNVINVDPNLPNGTGGTPYNDLMLGTEGRDLAYGNGGDDVLHGWGDNDTLVRWRR